MKTPLLIIAITGSYNIYGGCFTEHVREGRHLNQQRRSQYFDLAQKHGLGKEAKKVSRSLIGLENLMIPFARYFDFRAKKYKDINLFCDEFVDINLSPDFTTKPAKIPSEKFVKKLKIVKSYEKEVRELLQNYKWEEVRELSHEVISKFPNKETHCLQKHSIESIGRIAWLAPDKIEMAKDNNLKNPKRLISSMIKLHFMGFGYAQRIDAKAYELQKVGIPIVCRDIPPVKF